MILVALLLPLALYLLVLGWINRQPRPVLVSGTWDFIGLLFAASGFLLIGGPAILSSSNERLRMLWIHGELGEASLGLDFARDRWLLAALLYFILVLLSSGLVFWHRRRVTCIYNVEPAVVEMALADVCERLELEPIRSGNLFVFGLTLNASSARNAHPPGVQAPHALPPAGALLGGPDDGPDSLAEEIVGQNAVLELDAFAAMKHVTLRWDPHDAPLRPVLESELARHLARHGAPDHETGGWLTTLGTTLLGVAFLSTVFLVLRALLRP